MAMTEKKRKTDAAWKRRNISPLTCKVYKADAEEFKAYAAAQGKSVNELLRGFVSDCLGRPLERRDKAQGQEQPEQLEE